MDDIESTVLARSKVVSILKTECATPQNAPVQSNSKFGNVADKCTYYNEDNDNNGNGHGNRADSSSSSSSSVDEEGKDHTTTTFDLQEGTLESAYDHANCHDCSCVPELTLDCVNHFNKLSAQGLNMTQRLKSIIELRVRAYIQIHILLYTYTHTNIHTYRRTYAHTHDYSCIHTCSHTHTHVVHTLKHSLIQRNKSKICGKIK